MNPLPRQSRHAVMVCQMLALIVLSIWQILSGPTRHQVIWHVPGDTYNLLALATFGGAATCLAATIVLDSWSAAAFELFGSIVLISTLFAYLASEWGTSPYPDTDLLTGLASGLLLGLLIRTGAISRDIIAVVKSRQAPPMGDMDLLAAGRVDSTSALVVATHGGRMAKELTAIEDSLAEAKEESRSRQENQP